MLDPAEREKWYRAYLCAGLCAEMKFTPSASGKSVLRVRRWAKSMALIAEQFVDNQDEEPAETAST